MKKSKPQKSLQSSNPKKEKNIPQSKHSTKPTDRKETENDIEDTKPQIDLHKTLKKNLNENKEKNKTNLNDNLKKNIKEKNNERSKVEKNEKITQNTNNDSKENKEKASKNESNNQKTTQKTKIDKNEKQSKEKPKIDQIKSKNEKSTKFMEKTNVTQRNNSVNDDKKDDSNKNIKKEKNPKTEVKSKKEKNDRKEKTIENDINAKSQTKGKLENGKSDIKPKNNRKEKDDQEAKNNKKAKDDKIVKNNKREKEEQESKNDRKEKDNQEAKNDKKAKDGKIIKNNKKEKEEQESKNDRKEKDAQEAKNDKKAKDDKIVKNNKKEKEEQESKNNRKEKDEQKVKKDRKEEDQQEAKNDRKEKDDEMIKSNKREKHEQEAKSDRKEKEKIEQKDKKDRKTEDEQKVKKDKKEKEKGEKTTKNYRKPKDDQETKKDRKEKDDEIVKGNKNEKDEHEAKSDRKEKDDQLVKKDKKEKDEHEAKNDRKEKGEKKLKNDRNPKDDQETKKDRKEKDEEIVKGNKNEKDEQENDKKEKCEKKAKRDKKEKDEQKNDRKEKRKINESKSDKDSKEKSTTTNTKDNDLNKEKNKDKNDNDKKEKELIKSTSQKEEQAKEKEKSIILERKEQIKTIGNIDLPQYKFLFELFKTDSTKAIEKSEEYLKGQEFSTYDEFLEDVKKTQKSNICIRAWHKKTLIARCYECQITENSCVCIPCFLAGKHENHHTFLQYGESGNCDCGDPKLWKPSGNCCHHHGPDSDPDITQMTPENRKKFITVFSSAINGAFTSHNDAICSKILDWIQKFIQFGDGIRRCCSFAITRMCSEFFFNELMNLEYESVSLFIDLIGKLVSDQLFALRMSCKVIPNYLFLKRKIAIMIINGNYDKKSKPFRPIKKFLKFSFHFFNKPQISFLIRESEFNWVNFIISTIQLILETFERTNGSFQPLYDGQIYSEIYYLTLFLQIVLQMDDQHENIQKFINNYSKLLVKYEASFSYNFNIQNTEYLNMKDLSYCLLISNLYDLNYVFTIESDSSEKNKKFSIDETFSNLVDFLRSDINFHVESIYKSSENVAISPFLPLHHFFYCILSSHQNTTEIILESCKKKRINIQDFCNLISIYPLRLLASLFAPERFENISFYSFEIIKDFLGNPEKSFNIFFGLYQTLLGIAPDKEIMLYNVVKTFGLFFENPEIQNLPLVDELIYLLKQQEQIKKTAHFDAAVFIMSVLTDRSIISFDKILFKRLRVIELMMNGKPTSIDIETYINDKISNPLFGDDLASYAERVTTSNGSYFKLKNEDDFTPFFPLIFHVRRMKILSKYEDKLIPFLNYSKLPRNLDFKDCFRTKVYIALMYKCLLTENRLMETQVGLAMFVLSMQNGKIFEESSFNVKSPLKIECEAIEEIINNINNDDNFTTIQFKFESDKYNSIIELVESKQQLGYEAIRKANLPIQLKLNAKNDEEIQNKKKKKAGELKEQIIKDFQQKQKQFTQGEPIIKENENEDLISESKSNINNTKEQLQCSICQNIDSEDVIGFPCLSLHTIFPSFIENKLHKKTNFSLENIEKVFSLSICTHPVHFKCCKDLFNHIENGENNDNNINEMAFCCMIDRGIRNCLLPCLSNEKNDDNDEIFSIKPSNVMLEAINDFMIKAFRTVENIEINYVPLKSFIGVVSILEVRHRSRPECLDNPSVSILLRNLLLTLYFKYHGTEMEIKAKEPLMILVISILKSKKPIIEFKNFVKQISMEIDNDDDHLYEFLRRCAIIEDFSLKNSTLNKEEFIDWDEILSFESLLSRFEISSKNSKIIELPLFEAIPLAEKFISLYFPPFNLDIFDSSIIKYVDLLTGQVVIYDPNEKMKDKTKFPKLENYCKTVYNDGLAMFLCLTGPNASDLIIHCKELNYFFNMKGFYVDKFGDIDRGFKRGSILTLSHDRLENSIDKLLSGEVVLYAFNKST